MNRSRAIAAGIVVPVFGVFLFLAFLRLAPPRALAGIDGKTGISYEYVHDGRGVENRGRLVALRLKGLEGAPGVVKAVFRREGEDRWGALELEALGGQGLYAGELPGVPRGERIRLYFVVRVPQGEQPSLSDGGGEPAAASFTIPPGAERGALELRFEGGVCPGLKALQLVLLWAAPLFLVHGFYRVLLYLLREAREKGADRRHLHRAYLDGLACFLLVFTAVLPLGIPIRIASLGTPFEGWPFGAEAASTAAEVILIAWFALLAWRHDLLRGRGDPRPGPDRLFAGAFLASLFLSALSFLLSVGPGSGF